MRLLFNGVADLEETMVIDTWENSQYKEIWVYSKETGSDERAMCGLINGELNPYPLSYVLSADEVLKALDYFEKSHEIPTFITWHDDQFL